MVMVLVVVVVVSIESQLPTGLCARWTGAAAVKKKPCSWLGWVAGWSALLNRPNPPASSRSIVVFRRNKTRIRGPGESRRIPSVEDAVSERSPSRSVLCACACCVSPARASRNLPVLGRPRQIEQPVLLGRGGRGGCVALFSSVVVGLTVLQGILHRIASHAPPPACTNHDDHHGSRAQQQGKQSPASLFDAGRGRGGEAAAKRPGGLKRNGWAGKAGPSVGQSAGRMVHRDQPVGVTKVSEGEGGGCIFFPQLAVISRLQGGRKVTAKTKQKKERRTKGREKKTTEMFHFGLWVVFFILLLLFHVPCCKVATRNERSRTGWHESKDQAIGRMPSIPHIHDPLHRQATRDDNEREGVCVVVSSEPPAARLRGVERKA